jgi:hypothetical protein
MVVVNSVRGAQAGQPWNVQGRGWPPSKVCRRPSPGPSRGRSQLYPVVRPGVAVEDGIYTIVHWQLTKPLLAGGGRVVTFPVRLWWIPALYAGAIPLLLICKGPSA